MKSLEKKSEPSFDEVTSSSFPSFYVCDEQMKEITDWPIDGEYTLKVTVHVKNKTQTVGLEGTDTDSVLEVLSYEVIE